MTLAAYDPGAAAEAGGCTEDGGGRCSATGGLTFVWLVMKILMAELRSIRPRLDFFTTVHATRSAGCDSGTTLRTYSLIFARSSLCSSRIHKLTTALPMRCATDQ